MKSNTNSPQLRLGIRAHDLGRLPPEELARKVAAVGLDCVQLALGKAVEGVEMAPGVIHAGMASSIGAAFARSHVRIEVLGCYINPIHPDQETRRSLLGLFKEHLQHASGFGCEIVALESGSLNGDYSPHPDNGGEAAFQKLLESMEDLVSEAARCGVVVGIEAVTSHVISTPEKMRRLLDAIPSHHLQVVFDPVNLLSPANCMEQKDIIRRSFDQFGDRIAVVHLKDFRMAEGQLTVCPAGTGLLEFDDLLPELARRKPGIALLFEETGPDQIAGSVRFIRNKNIFANS